MPAAALGLKKYLGATVSSSTSANDEDPPAPLGHSEVSAVQHTPGEVVKPELGQRRENDGEIPAAVGGKKSGYVLNEHIPSGLNKLIGDPGELEEEGTALSVDESCSSAGDGKVLAGEAAAEEVDTAMLPSSPLIGGAYSVRPMSSSVHANANGGDIIGAGDSREALSQHGSPPLVGLALEDDSHPCSFESEVDAADS